MPGTAGLHGSLRGLRGKWKARRQRETFRPESGMQATPKHPLRRMETDILAAA
jgi:hypothetical protein